MEWITHEEDVWWEFRGSRPQELEPGRYYKGSVDGFADFGVFVDIGDSVTGLLHRSELDRRLESLDWDAGDTVFVQVKNVRDNGDVDLGWSIRQAEDEFRGAHIHDPNGDADGEAVAGNEDAADDEGSAADEHDEPEQAKPDAADADDGSDAADEQEEPDVAETESVDAGEVQTASADRSDLHVDATQQIAGEGADESDAADDADEAADEADEADEPDETADAEEPATADAADAEAAGTGVAASDGAEPVAAEGESRRSRAPVGTLSDRVGDTVRVEVEVVSIRQTSGPTVFEVRDETGAVECAAFEEAGVRAYPEVEVDDAVELVGEVELRREELQVETEELTVLEGERAAAVRERLEAAIADEARPDEVRPLAADPTVEALSDSIADAVEAVRRAVMEARPVVVRHAQSADGYVAGAAIERAVLPLVREEHTRADAEYHFFERRPLEDGVYDMDDATKDVTDMLDANERHGEPLPLVVLADAGSTVESVDAYDLLDVYGADRVVVDDGHADPEVTEAVEVTLNPHLGGAPDAGSVTSGVLAATVAAHVNPDVRGELGHLPAVSYWEDAPEAYVDLAAEAGYDAESTRNVREAVALEAYYQSYNDKRQLVSDLLFGDEEADADSLADHVSGQFRTKLDTEVETAENNLTTRTARGVTFGVLDTDNYTHRFDFPPTDLLLDELHRRTRDDAEGVLVTLGVGEDEIRVRSTEAVDVRAIGEYAREEAPNAGLSVVGGRDGRLEFLTGERDAVLEGVVAAVAAELGE